MSKYEYDFTTQIDRGVALLDREAPGWAEQINTRKLHLFSEKSCVLGQLAAQHYPDMPKHTRFRLFRNMVGIPTGRLSHYGFDVDIDIIAGRSISIAYHQLGKQWQARIKAIRKAEAIAKVTQADLALVG